MKTVLERILIIPDVHVPYENRRAFDLMIEVARHFPVDHIVILGDFADFYSVSSHGKSPLRVSQLETEIDYVNQALDRLDDLKASNKVFIAGNHEDRLRRYLEGNAPALFGTCRVEKLFRLSERGWNYVPYRSHYKLGHMHFTHDINGRAGKYAHYSAGQVFGGNAIIGHTHRMGVAYSGNARGESHVSAHLGWLGDRDQCDYLTNIDTITSWQMGFGMGYLEEGGTVHLQAIPVIDYRVCVEGKLFQG